MKSEHEKAQVYFDVLREQYRRDFKRFAHEQLVISSTRPGEFINFSTFTPGQAILHNVIETQRKQHGYVRVVLIKGRQVGASTYTSARAFHLAALHPASSTLLIAHDDATSTAIFEKCKIFYDRMLPALQPMRRYDNKQELVFENPNPKTRNGFPGLGSKMRFNNAKNVLAGTGTTQHFVHITEAAKYRSDTCGLLESSLMPAIHLVPGTCIINESTAFVGGRYFRACCERARSGKSEWRFCFVPWYVERKYQLPLEPGEQIHLDRTERRILKIAEAGQPVDGIPPMTIYPEQFKWRRIIIAGREDGENIFKQEYPTLYDEAWITMDLNVFDRQKLYDMRKDLQPPLYFIKIDPKRGKNFFRLDDQNMTAEDEYIAIWREPEPGHRYDIGFDTAVGIEGGDWSVGEVFDRETHEQVAEFHSHADGFDLADQIYWLGAYYNFAQVGVEMASTGFAVNSGLQRLSYPNLYIWRHRERAFLTLSNYSGWKTQRDSKAYMITIFRTRVNKLSLKIHSSVLWQEMWNYIKEQSFDPLYDHYRAAEGYDDCVMATGIALVIGDDESVGMRQGGAEPLSRHEQLQAAMNDKIRQLHTDNVDLSHPSGGVLKDLSTRLRGWD